MDLEQLCLSPQCGFASTEEGNLLTEDSSGPSSRASSKSPGRSGVSLRRDMRIIIWLLVLSCSTAWAQKKTVFVITDAEGVGGVCRQDQTEPKDQEMRQLLTGEINAAVEGFWPAARTRSSFGTGTTAARRYPR